MQSFPESEGLKHVCFPDNWPVCVRLILYLCVLHLKTNREWFTAADGLEYRQTRLRHIHDEGIYWWVHQTTIWFLHVGMLEEKKTMQLFVFGHLKERPDQIFLHWSCQKAEVQSKQRSFDLKSPAGCMHPCAKYLTLQKCCLEKKNQLIQLPSVLSQTVIRKFKKEHLKVLGEKKTGKCNS